MSRGPLGPDKQRLTDVDRANLVAYLDGELPDREEQFLAAKLAQSVSVRREMESLQKTWEMLDYLPRPQAADDFAARTLTQVERLDLRGAKLATAAGHAARRTAVALFSAASLLLALGTGYVAARWLWPDPTARLARDLPLAEHLDEYRDAGSFDFLKMLDESPAFNEESH